MWRCANCPPASTALRRPRASRAHARPRLPPPRAMRVRLRVRCRDTASCRRHCARPPRPRPRGCRNPSRSADNRSARHCRRRRGDPIPLRPLRPRAADGGPRRRRSSFATFGAMMWLERHAVGRCPRGRDEAFFKIALYLLFSPFGRFAVAAAARRQETHRVARVKLDLGLLVNDVLLSVLSRDDAEIDRALAPAMEAPGRIGRALEIDVGLAALQAAIGERQAEPAAIAARAAAVLATTVLLGQDREVDLLQLNRRVANVALTDGDACRFAVLGRPSAPAAAEDVQEQETAAVI